MVNNNYKIGVNIALIPDKEMYDRCIDLSNQLAQQGSDYILGQDAVPHISLIHGVTYTQQLLDDVTSISSIFENISMYYRPLNLRANDTFVGPMSGSFWLKVEKSQEIMRLQRELIERLGPFLTYDATKEMFVNPSEITEEIQWVKDFPVKSSLDKYNPHITLGYGKLENLDLPIDFRANTLAIYQLGKVNSCQREIKSFNFR